METIDTVDTIELTVDITRDMTGDWFLTGLGEVVCLEGYLSDNFFHPFEFSDFKYRSEKGVVCIDPRMEVKELNDVIKHLSKSEYPEYYL